MTWDYVAGFIDGEGCILAKRKGYALRISQTNFEVLNSILKFTGKGYVNPIKKRKPHWKDAWIYDSGGYEHTYFLLINVVDKLIVKKQEAEHAIEVLKDRIEFLQQRDKEVREKAKKVAELRNKGWTYREIGKELNHDFSYMRRLLKRYPQN